MGKRQNKGRGGRRQGKRRMRERERKRGTTFKPSPPRSRGKTGEDKRATTFSWVHIHIQTEIERDR